MSVVHTYKFFEPMTLENSNAIWFGTNGSQPQEGNVLVLNYHHDGESHWCSPDQAVARIEDILNGCKPKEEWGPRMEAMKIVPFGPWFNGPQVSKARAAHDEACSKARAAYDKARSKAWAAYNEACSKARAADDEACSKARAAYDDALSKVGAVLSEVVLNAGAEIFYAEPWAAAQLGGDL